MSERLTEAISYIVDYICDECEKGKMVRDSDMLLLTDPPKCPHKCLNCGHRQNFDGYYPHTRFIPKP